MMKMKTYILTIIFILLTSVFMYGCASSNNNGFGGNSAAFGSQSFTHQQKSINKKFVSIKSATSTINKSLAHAKPYINKSTSINATSGIDSIPQTDISAISHANTSIIADISFIQPGILDILHTYNAENKKLMQANAALNSQLDNKISKMEIIGAIGIGIVIIIGLISIGMIWYLSIGCGIVASIGSMFAFRVLQVWTPWLFGIGIGLVIIIGLYDWWRKSRATIKQAQAQTNVNSTIKQATPSQSTTNSGNAPTSSSVNTTTAQSNNSTGPPTDTNNVSSNVGVLPIQRVGSSDKAVVT